MDEDGGLAQGVITEVRRRGLISEKSGASNESFDGLDAVVRYGVSRTVSGQTRSGTHLHP